jgi:hypothetical protein
MKSQVTKTDTPQDVKTPSVLDRLSTPIIRTCVLNLIAQIALGTPMAAQAQRNSRPALMDRQNVIVLGACPDSMANKGPRKASQMKGDVRPNRSQTS